MLVVGSMFLARVVVDCRLCPECRTKSDFVLPSYHWFGDEAEKEKMIGEYKESLKWVVRVRADVILRPYVAWYCLLICLKSLCSCLIIGIKMFYYFDTSWCLSQEQAVQVLREGTILSVRWQLLLPPLVPGRFQGPQQKKVPGRRRRPHRYHRPRANLGVHRLVFWWWRRRLLRRRRLRWLVRLLLRPLRLTHRLRLMMESKPFERKWTQRTLLSVRSVNY